MPSTSRAEIEEQPRHHLDVADARHVGQHALLGRQQAGGEQRQRGVLVAFDVDGARQPLAAFNQQCGHVSFIVSRSSPSRRSRRGRRSLRAARRRSGRALRARQRSISAPDVARPSRAPSLTMKLPCVGETRAPPTRRALQPGAIDQRAGRPRNAVRHDVAAAAPDSGTRSRRSACRAAASACGTPATRAAIARSAAGSPVDDAKHRRQQHLAGRPAAGCDRIRTPSPPPATSATRRRGATSAHLGRPDRRSAGRRNARCRRSRRRPCRACRPTPRGRRAP